MKKRRPPRPKRKAPMAVGQVKVGDLPSSLRSGAAAKGSFSAEAPAVRSQQGPGLPRFNRTEALTLAPTIRTTPLAVVAPMTKARGWTIFAGLIISFLLVASAVVLFASYYVAA